MNVPLRSRERHIRRTKIIATIGPASGDEETLTRLIESGVNTVRLNFSHGTPDEHADVVKRVRRIARETGRAVGVLQDLQGPRLRTGDTCGRRFRHSARRRSVRSYNGGVAGWHG